MNDQYSLQYLEKEWDRVLQFWYERTPHYTIARIGDLVHLDPLYGYITEDEILSALFRFFCLNHPTTFTNIDTETILEDPHVI